ncbi:MAG: hypothetical protein KAS23_05165 [Anaerohalosphaera sp.]|nr:hypothetical protein [Anaerohalosphaera sp.]
MSHYMLDSQKILNTIGLLKKRIEERFPGGGLGRVCGELRQIALQTDETIETIQQKRYGYRMLIFMFVSALLVITYAGLSQLRAGKENITLIDMVQVLDAGFNVILLIGGAVIFLVSIENRTKRRKVIKAVNELRCLAHVIDSYQLTKDPCYLESNVIRTTHSPERNLNSFQLSRYLDYCSEMLSLVSKVGFLYVQDYHDSAAAESVNDLDDLTNGLSRKIWQKIMTIDKEPETS